MDRSWQVPGVHDPALLRGTRRAQWPNHLYSADPFLYPPLVFRFFIFLCCFMLCPLGKLSQRKESPSHVSEKWNNPTVVADPERPLEKRLSLEPEWLKSRALLINLCLLCFGFMYFPGWAGGGFAWWLAALTTVSCTAEYLF